MASMQKVPRPVAPKSVLMLIMFLVGGWSSVHSQTSGAAAGPLELSGGAKKMSTVSDEIVNGVLDWGSPSVGLLLDAAGGTCTGTLIGCRTFFTAAHCLCTDGDQNLTGAACAGRPDLLDPSRKLVFFQHAGLFGVSSVSVHPSYQFKSRSDLAILRLSTPVTGIRASRINQSVRPVVGSEGLIVGFGITGGNSSDSGLKRAGLVKTAACTTVPGSSHICWRFEAPVGAPGEDSNTCRGDSGGPLFVSQGGTTRLAGVTSGGFNPSCFALDESWDADVFVDRAWIESTAGNDLHRTDCGSLALAGEDGTTILFGADVLEANSPESRASFDVPPGTSSLRVALNAQAPFVNDFDLYLRRGTAPTTTSFTCKSDSVVGIDACEIANPQAGTWHALTQRAAGSGPFQLTATLFESSGGGGGGGDTSACVPDEFTLCAVGGRFEITSTAPRSLFPSLAGRVSPVIDGDLGGAFHYFAAEKNFHTVVKVALRPSGFYAVSAVALDPLEWTVRIRDALTGEVKSYTNPEGGLGVPTDSQAFAADP